MSVEANSCNDMRRVDAAFICLMLGLFWLYLAPDLATLSMGLDGVIYATIAKLAAAGHGSFWFPPYFDLDINWFSDSPPLGVWVQSQWFAVLGDAFWVENMFCAAMVVLITALMVMFCRAIAPEVPAWWSLAIFFAMPVASHALKNNSLESMVTVTSLLAVIAAWHGRKHLWMNVLVAAGCLAGMLIKGPVAMFPLVAPGIFALLVDGNWRRVISGTAVSVGSLLLAMFAIFSFDAAEVAIVHYLKTQLLASLAGDRHIDHGRAYQLGQLFINVGVAAIFIGIAWLSSRKIHFSRTSWAILAIGLAASLPLLISPRQYKHYLLPCLPFFAIWASLIASPYLNRLSRKYAWIAAALVIVFASARTAWQFGLPGKDADQLSDVAAIVSVIESSNMSVKHVEFCSAQYPLRAYLARHSNLRTVTITENATPTSGYIVCSEDQPDDDLRAVQSLHDGLVLWLRPARDHSPVRI